MCDDLPRSFPVVYFLPDKCYNFDCGLGRMVQRAALSVVVVVVVVVAVVVVVVVVAVVVVELPIRDAQDTDDVSPDSP